MQDFINTRYVLLIDAFKNREFIFKIFNSWFTLEHRVFLYDFDCTLNIQSFICSFEDRAIATLP